MLNRMAVKAGRQTAFANVSSRFGSELRACRDGRSSQNMKAIGSGWGVACRSCIEGVPLSPAQH